ncbi:hypothetical protein [Sorangium sp. So ce590]|uniref:hypothetical protein n=1 Tax=unclassified Sorangium TaxID=2621164 RepID=UPI003F60769D
MSGRFHVSGKGRKSGRGFQFLLTFFGSRPVDVAGPLPGPIVCSAGIRRRDRGFSARAFTIRIDGPSGGCAHAAIREDIGRDLVARDELTDRIARDELTDRVALELLLVESGSDALPCPTRPGAR